MIFYIDDKIKNWETQKSFTFGLKNTKFKEYETHLLDKALSKI